MDCLLFVVSLRRPGLDGPPAREAGGDNPEPRRLLHENHQQDSARPRAQDNHAPHCQQRELQTSV